MILAANDFHSKIFTNHRYSSENQRKPWHISRDDAPVDVSVRVQVIQALKRLPHNACNHFFLCTSQQGTARHNTRSMTRFQHNQASNFGTHTKTRGFRYKTQVLERPQHVERGTCGCARE